MTVVVLICLINRLFYTWMSCPLNKLLRKRGGGTVIYSSWLPNRWIHPCQSEDDHEWLHDLVSWFVDTFYILSLWAMWEECFEVVLATGSKHLLGTRRTRNILRGKILRLNDLPGSLIWILLSIFLVRRVQRPTTSKSLPCFFITFSLFRSFFLPPLKIEFWERGAPSPLNSPNQKYAQ